MQEPDNTLPTEAEASTEHSLLPPSAEKTLQWITVLSAAGLDYRLSRTAGQWHLHIPASQASIALSEIRAFEKEEKQQAHPRSTSWLEDHQDVWRKGNGVAFWAAYVLIMLYLMLGAFDASQPLHIAGAMSRPEFMQGEWWRSITALTMHSGLGHLMANVFFLFFIGQAVLAEVGRGLGISLILAGGITGNMIAILAAPTYQRSVGASTACFAALGLLCVIQAGHLYRRFHAWTPVWRKTGLPIAAGIALLGLTGTSEGSDIAAHFFGFLSGMALALPIAKYPSCIRQISRSMQWALLIISASLIPLAWFLAYLFQTPLSI